MLPDFSLEKLVGYVVSFGFVILCSLAAWLLFLLFARLDRRYRFGAFIAVPLGVGLFGFWGGAGGLIVAVAFVIILSLVVGAGAVLANDGFALSRHRKALAALLLGLGGALAGLIVFFNDQGTNSPAFDDYVFTDLTLDLPNPGLTGPHEVVTLTYGGGSDRHRPEYGKEADLITESVDGSKLVEGWSGLVGWIRTSYWGFDAGAFPRQGRVWMPEGEGPFPLVLIVHGNHRMEDFSDPGYAYLGELMASRGYVFVSVDENFLNSSFADAIRPIGRGISPENDARGWMLLEHLKLWREWNDDPEHRLAGKIDMENIALIGHSRGGEAVAIAAAFNTLDHYPDDATLTFDYHFPIKGIIAIAPVDGQYKPRKNWTPLKDVNYFTLHGSWDGDVESFAGARQYSRARFSGDHFRFKANLYIDGANHGQFNTGWGRSDYGQPSSWFLNTRPIMNGEDQRQIAKVYFSAFLEVVLRGQDNYLPLFADARRGARWLPDKYLVNNYEDSDHQWLAIFEEDIEAATATAPGSHVAGDRLSKWREVWVELKSRELATHAAVLAWDKRFHDEAAEYRITFAEAQLDIKPDSILTFTLSDAGEGTLPKDFDPPEEEDSKEEGKAKDKALDWTVVLVDSSGHEARLPLSHDQPLYPQLKAYTKRAQFLSGSKASEITFRRYALPLADFDAANPALDLTALTGLRFVFDRSQSGAVVVDNIGFAPKF